MPAPHLVIALFRLAQMHLVHMHNKVEHTKVCLQHIVSLSEQQRSPVNWLVFSRLTLVYRESPGSVKQ